MKLIKMSNKQEQVFHELSEQTEVVLRKRLDPLAQISASPGPEGRVRVQVISDRLNELTERKKQDFLWNILNEELKEKSDWISFIIGYGTDEEIYRPLEAK